MCHLWRLTYPEHGRHWGSWWLYHTCWWSWTWRSLLGGKLGQLRSVCGIGRGQDLHHSTSPNLIRLRFAQEKHRKKPLPHLASAPTPFSLSYFPSLAFHLTPQLEGFPPTDTHHCSWTSTPQTFFPSFNKTLPLCCGVCEEGLFTFEQKGFWEAKRKGFWV